MSPPPALGSASRLPRALCLLLLLCAPAPAFAQRSLSGTVTLEGAGNTSRAAAFDFRSLTTGACFTRTAVVAVGGSFTLPGLPADRLAVGVKGRRWLHKMRAGEVNLTAGNVTGFTPGGALLTGDDESSRWIHCGAIHQLRS